MSGNPPPLFFSLNTHGHFCDGPPIYEPEISYYTFINTRNIT